MKKKKILIAQNSLGSGGAEKVLIDILNNIDYKKYEVTLFLLNRRGVYLDKVNKNVKKISVINIENIRSEFFKKIFNKFSFLATVCFPKLIHKFFIGNNYDVEIAFLEGMTTKLISKSGNNKSKKIAWVHIDLKKYRLFSTSEEENIYKKFDKIICVSNDSRKSIVNLYPKIENKVKVIYNLIDSDNIKKKANENNVEITNKNQIVAIGRLNNQKRFDLLIKAHKKLLDEGIDNNLLILGEGELNADLMNLIEKLKVEKTVKLEGFKENPYPYIKQAKCIAMSSDYEGLPLVICESLVLGKAIVSTNCTGPAELLNYGEFGLISKCGDINQLKENLKKVISNYDIRIEMEKKSLERSEIFKKEKIIREIEKIIS